MLALQGAANFGAFSALCTVPLAADFDAFSQAARDLPTFQVPRPNTSRSPWLLSKPWQMITQGLAWRLAFVI